MMEDHGTRVIIYNLWEDDQGLLELDFDADPYVRNIGWLIFFFSLEHIIISIEFNVRGLWRLRIFN